MKRMGVWIHFRVVRVNYINEISCKIFITLLSICLLVSAAHKLTQQIGHGSGPVKYSDTLVVFLKDISQKKCF